MIKVSTFGQKSSSSPTVSPTSLLIRLRFSAGMTLRLFMSTRGCDLLKLKLQIKLILQVNHTNFASLLSLFVSLFFPVSRSTDESIRKQQREEEEEENKLMAMFKFNNIQW